MTTYADPTVGSLPPRDAGLAAAGAAVAAGLPDAARARGSRSGPSAEGWRDAGDAVRTLDDIRHAIGRDREAARAAALRLVALIEASAAGEPPCVRGGLAPWQERAIGRYILQRLDDPLRVKELAAQISLSVSHFCRAFKESFGTTPHLYLNRLRVERAQRLMLTTSEPLIQIALACGMADQAHFSKLFRRAVGDTPSSWRRRNLTGAHVEATHRRRTGSSG